MCSGEAEAFVQSGPAGQAEAEGFSRARTERRFSLKLFWAKGSVNLAMLREFRATGSCR